MIPWRRALPDPAFAQGSGAAGSVAAMFARVRWRWRLRLAARSIAVAGAAFAAAIVLGSTAVAIIAASIAAIVMVMRGAALSDLDAAKMVERAVGALDNLLITAAELAERPRPTRTDILDQIHRQAAERARGVDPACVVPLAQPFAVAAAVMIGCGALLSAGSDSIRARAHVAGTSESAASGESDLTVRVTPPAYTRRKSEVLENPVQISVIAGSHIQIEAGGATLRNWVATMSEAIELRTGAARTPKFLLVSVVPDAPPMLRVVAPGKDTAFAEPKGQLAIAVDGRDDFGLTSLALRFVKASGGGENVSFSEGEIALRIDRRSDQQWTAQASLALESLNLADGDILVYRAIARDTNPAGAPVQSEQYLIEIGKNAEIADAGFALPTEEKKYAISQQMVIYKTEQLIARLRQGSGAAGSASESRLEQSRLIGMEQRMVRAEVVFLGGGEVEDELEEAAKSDELTEGRLQNTGRAEMLRAINAMSRAEAQLNEGRPVEALVFERQALASLELALDRRRYFLRTLPDRSRIDVTRRLTGERREARSWTREQQIATGADALEALRTVMRELAAASVNTASVNGSLAARIAAIDPSAKPLQDAAVAVASAATDEARRQAIAAAMKAVTDHALETFSASIPIDLRGDPLGGALADELSRRPRQ